MLEIQTAAQTATISDAVRVYYSLNNGVNWNTFGGVDSPTTSLNSLGTINVPLGSTVLIGVTLDGMTDNARFGLYGVNATDYCGIVAPYSTAVISGNTIVQLLIDQAFNHIVSCS